MFSVRPSGPRWDLVLKQSFYPQRTGAVTVVSVGPMKKPLHPAITKTLNTLSDAIVMMIAAPFLLDRPCFIEQYPS
jgi:hypothetical protein